MPTLTQRSRDLLVPTSGSRSVYNVVIHIYLIICHDLPIQSVPTCFLQDHAKELAERTVVFINLDSAVKGKHSISQFCWCA